MFCKNINRAFNLTWRTQNPQINKDTLIRISPSYLIAS